MIGRTVSHYRILRQIGEGGMGVVYVAEDTVLGRRVAVKTLTAVPDKQHYRTRFLREARSASALTHPHIAAVYDYGETEEGTPFIVMELVEGQTLDELMRGGTLTLSRAVEIVGDVAEALAEAHRRGIVHRDIKPSNVALGARGEVKVLDFGLAKQLGGDPAPGEDAAEAQARAVTQTREGVVIGTPQYLSPEQALGAPVDARSDIFSLGSLLYECLAGRPAFHGTSAADTCARVIRDDPPPPSRFNPSVPPDLDRITLKALAKQPDARHQSAEEFLADLEGMKSLLNPVRAQAKTLPHRVTTLRTGALAALPRTFQRPRNLIAAFLTALALGVGLWVVNRQRGAQEYKPSPIAVNLSAEGAAALRDGTYHKAAKLLRGAVGEDDRFPVAHAGLAEALVELDDNASAKDEINRARSLSEGVGLPPRDRLYLDAVAETVNQRFDLAVEKYLEVVERTPDGDGAGKSHAYVDLGRAYERRGDLKRAAESYLEATARDPQSAAAHLRLGVLSGQSADASADTFARAAGELDRAEALYERASNFEGVTEALLQRGALLSRAGNKSLEARAQLRRALDITRTTTRNQHQEVRALLLLSGVAAREGKTAEAKQHAAEAVNSARADGMENLTAQGLVDLGSAFIFSREYDEAERYLKQALELAQAHRASLTEAQARLALAKLYVQKESLDEGLIHVERALDFYRQAGYGKETSEALLLRGRAKLLKGDYETALQSFDQAMELAGQMQDATQLARAHTEIGFLLAARELYPAALRHYDRSFEINRSLDDPRRTAFSLLARADMLWRLGAYDESGTALSQASVVAERIGDEYRQLFHTRVFLTQARIELSRRNFAEAIKRAGQAQAVAGTKIRYAAIEAKYTLGLARALSGQGREGVSLCRGAAESARTAPFSEPPLVAAALLALADAELEAGDAQDSLGHALEAQEKFTQKGLQESEYRAHLTAARALHWLKQPGVARAHLARADELLSDLQRNWGGDAFYSYIARPDLRSARDQLLNGLTPPPDSN